MHPFDFLKPMYGRKGDFLWYYMFWDSLNPKKSHFYRLVSPSLYVYVFIISITQKQIRSRNSKFGIQSIEKLSLNMNVVLIIKLSSTAMQGKKNCVSATPDFYSHIFSFITCIIKKRDEGISISLFIERLIITQ